MFLRSLRTSFELVRWHQTADYGTVPNPAMPKTFMAVAHDIVGEASDKSLHSPKKQIVARRLVLGGASMAYGVDTFPLNGPFPVSLGANPDMVNAVRVVYDQSFFYNKTSLDSGFFACCKDTRAECDDPAYNWQPITQSLVDARPEEQTIDLRLKALICEPESRLHGHRKKQLPTWIGYAWAKSPFPEDLSATIYSDNVHRLPATLWRCQLSVTDSGTNRACDEIWKLS